MMTNSLPHGEMMRPVHIVRDLRRYIACRVHRDGLVHNRFKAANTIMLHV